MVQTSNKQKISSVQLAEPIVINARGKKLGRLASEVAHLLMGKQYASFKRHILNEVKVTIMDAAKLDISQRKIAQKRYVTYSGYPGGIRHERVGEVIAKKGVNELLRRAVYGMLPANKLRTPRMKNLIIKE